MFEFLRLNKKYKGKKINYDNFDPITLDKTNNKFWYVYDCKNNLTFKTLKENDIILNVWKGKPWPIAI